MAQLLGWRAGVDLFVLAAAIYFHWSQEARALRVTFGILDARSRREVTLR